MMKYQIDQYIPMSLDEAEVDWALLGDSLHAQNQYEILLTSTAKSYAEERLELVENLGFNDVLLRSRTPLLWFVLYQLPILRMRV